MDEQDRRAYRWSHRHPQREAGFTLIEIMVVVVILGLLAAIVAPNVMRRIDQAQVTKVKNDIRAYEAALNLYRLDQFKYPTTEQGLEALVQPPNDPSIRNYPQGGYLSSGVKKDPWGNEYQYLSPGQHGEFDIYSLGADGQVGGEDLNADIGNWNLDE